MNYMHEIGYFGNIWVRSNLLEKKGDTNGGGHLHHFDHVSLLVKGSVEVEVEGQEPKIYTAPKFIVVKKEHKHKFTALEDGVIWYCVFALRDVDGNVTDVYSGDNSPYNGPVSSDEEILKLEKSTVIHDN